MGLGRIAGELGGGGGSGRSLFIGHWNDGVLAESVDRSAACPRMLRAHLVSAFAPCRLNLPPGEKREKYAFGNGAISSIGPPAFESRTAREAVEPAFFRLPRDGSPLRSLLAISTTEGKAFKITPTVFAMIEVNACFLFLGENCLT